MKRIKLTILIQQRIRHKPKINPESITKPSLLNIIKKTAKKEVGSGKLSKIIKIKALNRN